MKETRDVTSAKIHAGQNIQREQLSTGEIFWSLDLYHIHKKVSLASITQVTVYITWEGR